MLHLVLLILAAGAFALSLVPSMGPNWNRLVSLGLTLLTLSMISF